MTSPATSFTLAALALAPVALAGLAGTASAEQVDAPLVRDDATYSLELGSQARTFGDTSAAILATDDFAGPRLTLGRSLTRTRVPFREADLGVFVRYAYAVADGTMFQELTTALSQHAFAAGLRADAPIWWRLRGTAQAELGLARTALEVDDGVMTPVDDHAWGPYGAASLGVDFGLIDRRGFRLGLALEVGYAVTAPVDLRAFPADRPDEELSIPTDYASLGKLDTRGRTMAFLLRGSF